MAKTKEILAYTLLPQFKPRLKRIFLSGFVFVPYLIALVYQTVRLLPSDHPYLKIQNIGHFGITHVISAAANNLILKRNNIDQIILFILILVGLVLGAAQIILFGFSLFFQTTTAIAATMPTTFEGFFVTPAGVDRHQDLAGMMMDLTFGVPGIFESCVSLADVDCLDSNNEPILDNAGGWILSSLGWPFPIHHALHSLLGVYSIGLLVVAVMITGYFIATVILETAQSGTPFGRRFNKVWAPVRIVVAFGLLIPIGSSVEDNEYGGLNSAQHLVLYVAKYGSGFATNGWRLFNQDITGTYLGEVETLIAKPNIPEIGGITHFLFVAAMCADIEFIKFIQQNGGTIPTFEQQVNPYLVKTTAGAANYLAVTYDNGNAIDYQELINFADGESQVRLVFGIRNEEIYNNKLGAVNPVCGEMLIALADPRDPQSADNKPEPGAWYIQRWWWYAVQFLFWDEFTYDEQDSLRNTPNYPVRWARFATSYDKVNRLPQDQSIPPPDYIRQLNNDFKEETQAALELGISEHINSDKWNFDIFQSRGWAGAALWYPQMADMSRLPTIALFNVPMVKKWPEIMEKVVDEKRRQNANVDMATRFNPVKAGQEDITLPLAEQMEEAAALWSAFKYFQDNGYGSTSHTDHSGAPINDFIIGLFGAEGLINAGPCSEDNTHPLALLAGIGNSLMTASIRNLGLSVAAAGSGVILGIPSQLAGQSASVVIDFLMTITMITMTIGYILFYIVPFLPFIYFFFAFTGWVKGIFEAMVGVPLWALAHIRIDGDGLPGSAGVTGYFLLFEIFLRPILIVFGLLASISTFSAIVSVLHMVWQEVVYNVTGFNFVCQNEIDNGGTGDSLAEFIRSPLDAFFFTAMYAVVVYMLATASFKLIDLIPEKILRWMGQNITTFSDSALSPGEQLTGKFIGAQQVIQEVGGGATNLLKGAATATSKQS